MTDQDVLKLGEAKAAECGLKVSRHGANYRFGNPMVNAMTSDADWYSADDVHKLLGSGVETFSMSEDMGVSAEWARVERFSDNVKTNIKRSGLLINIRPIKEKSREDKMEELLKKLVSFQRYSGFSGDEIYSLADSARKLLDEVAK